MVKNSPRFFLSAILLAILPAASLAQDAKTLLNSAAKAMGAENLRSLQYSGSGSLYLIGTGETPKGPWPHSIMKNYSREISLDMATSRLHLGTQPQSLSSASPWPEQFEHWNTPYTFIKGALANNATIENKTVFGTPMKVVTFSVQNNKVTGYFGDKDVLERIETSYTHPTAGAMQVETNFHDYQDFGGVKVPTTISQKQNGFLAWVLIVKEAKAMK